MKALVVLSAVVSIALAAGVGSAEKPPTSPQGLRDGSTHIVVGTVKAIYSRQEKSANFRHTRYVAEVKVAEVEKGDGLEKGGLAYVRYWNREWIGSGPVPPGTNGHSGTPKEGDTLRIHLARNAYDGFDTENKDGGFNVLGVNGFQPAGTPPK